MARKNIYAPFDDNELNKINYMFIELYDEYIAAGDNARDARVKAEKAVADAIMANQTARDAKGVADLTRDEMLAIIREQTQNGDLAPEIAQARGGKSTLGERLNSTDQQLAQIENLENYEITSKGRRKQGAVVFISDDAHIGDWEVLRPIFEAEGVPFCSAVVTEWQETRPDSRMTWEQLRYLQDEMGCEIMSHSHTHGRPTRIIDMTESQVRYEYEHSRNELIRRGFNVQTYRVPGGLYNTRNRNLAREYYRAMVTSNTGRDGLNHLPLETYDLVSIWLDNESDGGAKSFDYYKDHIDRAEEEGALLIISTHGYALDGLSDLFTQVVQYAKQRSQVLTMRDALNRLGNIFESGDYSTNTRGDRLPLENYFAVGADGSTAGGLNVAGHNQYDGNTPWHVFPLGETINTVSGDVAETSGLPEGSGGVLRNMKATSQRYAFNYQYYEIVRNKKVYYRSIDSEGNFNDWALRNVGMTFVNEQARTFSDGLETYDEGINFDLVTSSSSDFSESPQGSGIRITYKINGTNPAGSFQLFIPIYTTSPTIRIRRALSNTEWRDWVRDGSQLEDLLIRKGVIDQEEVDAFDD